MKFIILFLLMLLLIVGCGANNGFIKYEEIYVGTDGIVAEFFNTPEEVFEDRPFLLNFEVGNNGAYPKKDEMGDFTGYITLGIEDDYMSLSGSWEGADWIEGQLLGSSEGKTTKFTLKGRTMDDTFGGRGFLSIPLKTEKMRAIQGEKHDTDILATVCYPYKTIATPMVCIDPGYFSFVEREKSCEIKDITLSSQGAPVAVTKIETEILPEGKEMIKPMFLIYIENKGNGEVLSKNNDDLKKACSAESLNYESFNLISVKAKLGNNPNPLQCSLDDNGNVRLKSKKAMVRCTFQSGVAIEKGTYMAPLEITLEYGYMFTISKKVTVKKILTYGR